MSALLSRPMPDPAKAHGAWVYLVVSILAGALSVAGQGFVPALFAGLGYAGIFLLASAGALHPRPAWRRRAAWGLLLAAGAPLLALRSGGDPNFFAYALVAAFPAGAAVWFAQRDGFMSPIALCFAVAALVVAAPSAACAGGGTAREGWLLGILLTPFFVWRTWHIRVALARHKGWTRADLRRQGLREALLAVLWTAGAVVAIHVLPRGV
ncbi:MAG: hypothetical protein H6700_12405 [Myxococcales bacterium]|nr:hypothetical protein [Myxococcales bacterium]MCB9896841.1 hypothetical protein [Planctomycetota bacterium]